VQCFVYTLSNRVSAILPTETRVYNYTAVFQITENTLLLKCAPTYYDAGHKSQHTLYGSATYSSQTDGILSVWAE